MKFEVPKASTGYTPEEKVEALKQTGKKETRQEPIFDQQMESFFDRHNKESKGDRESLEYFNTIEKEYQDGHFEIPLTQVQFELASLNKDAETFSKENNQQKLLETQQKIKELSFLQNALSEKLGISKEKFNLTDLTERLRISRKQYAIDVRNNPEDSLLHSQFVKYNKLVESFTPENFNLNTWKEVLTEVDNDIIAIEGTRDDILRDLANKNLAPDIARERLKGTLAQEAEWHKYKELLEAEIYGPGPKTAQEKQKIEE